MDQDMRFDLVFMKLRSMLDEEERATAEWQEISIHGSGGITREELDDIDNLRRIVLEVTEPLPMSFTTT